MVKKKARAIPLGSNRRRWEIPEAGPHDRDLRRQRMRVDDRGDGIGGVVEAVDEFKAERDEQGDAKENEGHDGGRRRHGGEIADQRRDDIDHANRETNP